MRKRDMIKIKKVSPLGILIRIISFVFFIYSIYKFDNTLLFDQIYGVYIFLYTLFMFFIILKTIRNIFKLKYKIRFNILVSLIFVIVFLLFANSLASFLLAEDASIKHDIYSMYLILLSLSILLVEYSYFILGYKDIKSTLKQKNKE